ncbi:leucine-rich repeat domain-containing protein [Gimesia maris]|uniref:leucine-rich repeat domain-containing protein n=1 Tax=Gimesia maris TaxID=122 RepID=UPI003A91ADE0
MSMKPRTSRKRSLLIGSMLILLACLTAGGVIVGNNLSDAIQQRRVIQWLSDNRGQGLYRFETEGQGDIEFKTVDDGRYRHEAAEEGVPQTEPQPPGPAWLRDFLGIDYFDDIIWVSAYPQADMRDIRPLANLPHLESLEIEQSYVSSLTPLANLKQLRCLSLIQCQITDVSPLAELTNLKYLILAYNPVNDVKPLHGLKQLQFLFLNETNVSEADYQAIQKALPDCQIQWSRAPNSP